MINSKRQLLLSFTINVIESDYDRDLFEKLYNKYRQPMLYRAKTILSNKMDAEDAVHEVFLQLAAKYMYIVKWMTSEVYMKNYLLKAVKNAALNISDKRKCTDISLDDTDFGELNNIAELSDNDFVERICTHIDYERIVNAIRQLDDVYREVLYFHFILELSASETADILSRNLSTVKKQLVRGKQLLLKTLEL